MGQLVAWAASRLSAVSNGARHVHWKSTGAGHLANYQTASHMSRIEQLCP